MCRGVPHPAVDRLPSVIDSQAGRSFADESWGWHGIAVAIRWLTDEGRAAANQSNAPAGLAELHQAWLASRALSQPQKSILQILLQIYPRAISREDLAEKAGVSSLSSGYRANVSTLSGLQLVVYPGSNMVQANGELLFPAELR